jgi:L-threonylcarbamoyladenylate synthase
MVTEVETPRGLRTAYWRVDPVLPDPEIVARAAALLRAGGLVAFPTETVYGLGANAFDQEAVRRLFAAKGRPVDNPLIVHVAAKNELADLVREVPAVAKDLVGVFWPGPLTLVLPRSRAVPPVVTAGLDKVAVRMPAHPVALALIRAAGVPVAAPSANYSGRPSPTMAAHVLEDLDGRIEAVLDGGPAPVGVESTVLDLTVTPPVILRPGGITAEQLSAVLDGIAHHPEQTPGRPQAPGMKYRHYAPRTPLWLVDAPPEAAAARLGALAAEARAAGKSVVILTRRDHRDRFPEDRVVVCGESTDPAGVAAGLYTALRECDLLGADLILAEGLPPTGLGRAVMNRLRKAATKTFVNGVQT